MPHPPGTCPALPDPDEDVLRQFIRFAAARHPAHKAVHARQMRVIHPFERRHISRRSRPRRPVMPAELSTGRTVARLRPSSFPALVWMHGSAEKVERLTENIVSRWGCLPTTFLGGELENGEMK